MNQPIKRSCPQRNPRQGLPRRYSNPQSPDELTVLLQAFFESISRDHRINKSHLAVYMALLLYWQQAAGGNPIKAFGRDVLQLARVSASSYYRCLAQLHACGYIHYEPSFDRTDASSIAIIRPPERQERRKRKD